MNLFSPKRFPNRLLLYVLVLLAFVMGLLVFRVLSFHLISTTPNLKAVTIITPSVVFNYSSRLSETGMKVSSRDPIVKSFAVNNKSLVVNLSSATLIVGKTYTITVGSLQDTKNRKLGAKTYSFKVVSVSFSELSKSQQADVMKRQANVPYTRSSITYSGFDVLTNNGLSTYQLEDVKQAFFLYSNSIKQKVSRVTLVNDSLVLGPYDSNSPNPISSSTFSVKVDDTALGAKLVYSGLSAAELYLYDQVSGGQLFDSGSLTPASF